MRDRVDAVHVGFPRCGSTFLQQEVFKRHPEINIMFRGEGQEDRWIDHYRHIFIELRRGIGTSNYPIDGIVRKLGPEMEDEYDEERKNVISYEGLIGPQAHQRNDLLLAESIRDIFGPVKIIVVLREQYGFLYSLWSQNVKMGYSLSLRKFLSEKNNLTYVHNKYYSVYNKILYSEYIKSIFNIFGKENVKVLFLEDLKSNKKSFVQKIYKFIEVEDSFFGFDKYMRNQSLPYYQVNLMRFMNYVTETQFESGILPEKYYWWYRDKISKNPISFAGKIDKKSNVKKMVSSDIKESIEDSNSELKRLTGKDLKSIGYEI